MTTLALGPQWLDANYLIEQFGLIGVLAIVFAESGLLIGFFLPGDSLLFTTGLLVTTNQISKPLWLVCTLVGVAAILGDQAGYLFGRKVGPSLFRRPDSKLFKQENVEKAHEFFEKYGPKSLVLARFVPVIRTFTPIIAGVSRMNYRSFLIFNIIGGLLWGVGVTLLGAALGKIEFVNKNIELMLVAIVLISVVPIIIEFLRARSKSKKAAAEAAAAPQQAPESPYSGYPGDPGAGQAPYGGEGRNGYPGAGQSPYGGEGQGGYPGTGRSPYPGQSPYPGEGRSPYGDQGRSQGQSQSPYPGQNSYPGQSPYAGQNPHPGQNPYPGQNPHAGQNPYPGQNPHPGQSPYAGPGQVPYPGDGQDQDYGQDQDQDPGQGPEGGPRPPGQRGRHARR
ncbi:VTT domain-containing protein [Streptomyces roseoverticillatus]|uniref:DedA family protein n=1 Tax=Streptomyces roseoverticillatus TaxID=66429 RepID=UPI001F21643C|nr:VTT domain-containing protein [Streptomyces roseoverticillatus]MCF3100517.1 VTT domain-containing protein [Streptomyces roseoverticillatus]